MDYLTYSPPTGLITYKASAEHRTVMSVIIISIKLPSIHIIVRMPDYNCVNVFALGLACG